MERSDAQTAPAVGVQGAPRAPSPERSAWRRNAAARAECSRQAVRAGGKRPQGRAQRQQARSSPAFALAGDSTRPGTGGDQTPGGTTGEPTVSRRWGPCGPHEATKEPSRWPRRAARGP